MRDVMPVEEGKDETFLTSPLPLMDIRSDVEK